MQTRIFLATLSLAALVLVSWSTPPRTSEEVTARPDGAGDDERAFERELGRRSLEGNCMMCHSIEMIETQRLTPEQWAAEVEKMVGWGAPVPPEETELLVSYLAEQYPSDGDAPEFPRLTLADAERSTRPEPDPDALPPGDPARGTAVHREHCATCHGEDGLGGDLGMSLIARSILLRPDDYRAILRDGRHRMPGFQFVLGDQEIADTLAWYRERSQADSTHVP